MIDFSKYSLREIQAIVQVLDILTEDMPEEDIGYTVAMSYYCVARKYEDEIMRQHEHAMARIVREDAVRKQASAAGEAPADKVQLSSIYGTCTAADPPAPPDMFGWVGDALDDLCAAGEVLGADE